MGLNDVGQRILSYFVKVSISTYMADLVFEQFGFSILA